MTDILERLNDLKTKKIELQNEANKIRTDFESYITNQDIPLSERWSLFVKSPDELNYHEDYLIDASSEGLQYILDNWFDAPEIYGRGKKIETKNLFENIFKDESLNYNENQHSEGDIKLYKEAMEDILEQNCGSFCFDW